MRRAGEHGALTVHQVRDAFRSAVKAARNIGHLIGAFGLHTCIKIARAQGINPLA